MCMNVHLRQQSLSVEQAYSIWFHLSSAIEFLQQLSKKHTVKLRVVSWLFLHKCQNGHPNLKCLKVFKWFSLNNDSSSVNITFSFDKELTTSDNWKNWAAPFYFPCDIILRFGLSYSPLDHLFCNHYSRKVCPQTRFFSLANHFSPAGSMVWNHLFFWSTTILEPEF